MEETYYKLDLGHRTIKFRKWKVKDRKQLKKVIDKPDEILKVMVLDCLEDPNTDLSPEEFEYIFIKIREASISDNFNFGFNCSCGATTMENKENYKISDVIKFTFSEYKDIVIKDKDISIKLGPVRNKKFYNDEVMNPQNADLTETIDLVLHVSEFNNKQDFTYNDLLNYFLDMDADLYDKIFDEYSKYKFSLINTKDINCKRCKKTFKFAFDEIPEFFPETWFKR